MNCPVCQTSLVDEARFCASCGSDLSRPKPSPTAAAEIDALTGKVVAMRYRVLSKLGQGGMGTVYKAEQVSLKRMVALKVLDPALFSSPDNVRRFHAEAETAAKLSHPHTVTLYDFGQAENGLLFIAMELIQGRSLRAEVAAVGALPAERVLDIGEQIASSIADAHEHGIVHRDLKPDNVMLSERAGRKDFARVLDFGIAKLRDQQAGGISAFPAVTRQGDILGTPLYMSPEQILGERVDGRTDVYSLGVMLYEMVTGRLPFDAQTVAALLSMHINAQPIPFAQRRPDLVVPHGVGSLIMRCLAKSRDVRPATMEAVRNEALALKDAIARSSGPTQAPSGPMFVPGQPPASGPIYVAPPPTGPVYGSTPQPGYPQAQPPGYPPAQAQPVPYPAPHSQPSGYPAPQAQPAPYPAPHSQPSGYPQPGTQPSGYPQPGTQPSGYPQPGTQPSGFPQPGTQPSGYPQPGTQPSGYPQPGTQPSGYPQPERAQPQQGYPAPPARSGSAVGLWVLIAVLVLGGAGAGIYFLTRSHGDSQQHHSNGGDDDPKGDDDSPKPKDPPSDGWRVHNTKYPFFVDVPNGFTFTEQSAMLTTGMGEVNGENAMISALALPLPHDYTEEQLTTMADQIPQGAGGNLVEKRTRTVNGVDHVAVVYDLPAQNMRGEVVLFPHDDLLVALVVQTPPGSFDASSTFRDYFFGRLGFDGGKN